MEDLLAWVIDNKEWLFSGIGLVLIAGIGRLIFQKTRTSSSQTIRAGDHSTNIQAGRDINFRKKNMRGDVEER